MDGDLRQPKLPLILGHEIVGTVVEKGAKVERFALGQRVGVPWLGRTCGHCGYCTSGRENLCDEAQFTACWGILKWPSLGEFGWPPGSNHSIGAYGFAERSIHRRRWKWFDIVICHQDVNFWVSDFRD